MSGFATFLSVAIGFGLVGYGISPLINRAEKREADLGCLMALLGIAIIVTVTTVKVLS